MDVVKARSRQVDRDGLSGDVLLYRKLEAEQVLRSEE